MTDGIDDGEQEAQDHAADENDGGDSTSRPHHLLHCGELVVAHVVDRLPR
jgi:hypothetical protein